MVTKAFISKSCVDESRAHRRISPRLRWEANSIVDPKHPVHMEARGDGNDNYSKLHLLSPAFKKGAEVDINVYRFLENF